MPHNSQQPAEQLRFLLESSAGPKFIFAVCDDPERVSTLISDLFPPGETNRSALLDADSFDVSQLLDSMVRAANSGATSINVIGLDACSESERRKLFNRLNFHRDSISALGVPVILWIQEERLPEFAALAPDFWSRRSAVVRFSETAPADRIRRLFANYEVPKLAKFEREMREATASITECESALFDCFNKDAFSIAKIDSHIARLRQATSVLIGLIDSGREIDVALWLWNALHLDPVLQRTIENWRWLPQGSDDIFDYRHQVLVQVASNLAGILQEYQDSIASKCRVGQRISLRAKIRGEILTVLAVLSRSAEKGTLSNDHIQFYQPGTAAYDEGVEQELRNRAARELETYLSGVSSKSPRFFTPDELEILKVLYATQQSSEAVAERLGISRTNAAEKIKHIHERVMLYLGELG